MFRKHESCYFAKLHYRKCIGMRKISLFLFNFQSKHFKVPLGYPKMMVLGHSLVDSSKSRAGGIKARPPELWLLSPASPWKGPSLCHQVTCQCAPLKPQEQVTR